MSVLEPDPGKVGLTRVVSISVQPSPFAPHPYVAPSGAPGFAGDRQWDKGFEFDKTKVERQSVRLVGRKEMTTPVLTVELADMVSPHPRPRPPTLPLTRFALLAAAPVLPGARAPAEAVVAALQPRPARDLAEHALRALPGLQGERAPRRARRG